MTAFTIADVFCYVFFNSGPIVFFADASIAFGGSYMAAYHAVVILCYYFSMQFFGWYCSTTVTNEDGAITISWNLAKYS